MTHIFTRMLLVFGLSLFLIGGVAAVPSEAATIKREDKLAEQVQPLHNKARVAVKAKALKKNACLTKFARKQAVAQATKQKMYHQDLKPILRKCNLRMVGENVAYGFTSAKSVHRAWMNSPGHKRNILNKKFKKAGFAAAKGKDGRIYWAVVFGS